MLNVCAHLLLSGVRMPFSVVKLQAVTFVGH